MNQFNLQTRRFAQVVAGGALVLVSQAHAGAVDVTAVTTDIAAQAAPIAAIGAAVLVLMVGIKAFKWVRKAMS
ncbi:MAG: phage coat protein [Acidobacteria bacterium]|nr:phage coat protein [Acidobacteriota bacterium]